MAILLGATLLVAIALSEVRGDLASDALAVKVAVNPSTPAGLGDDIKKLENDMGTVLAGYTTTVITNALNDQCSRDIIRCPLCQLAAFLDAVKTLRTTQTNVNDTVTVLRKQVGSGPFLDCAESLLVKISNLLECVCDVTQTLLAAECDGTCDGEKLENQLIAMVIAAIEVLVELLKTLTADFVDMDQIVLGFDANPASLTSGVNAAREMLCQIPFLVNAAVTDLGSCADLRKFNRIVNGLNVLLTIVEEGGTNPGYFLTQIAAYQAMVQKANIQLP